MTKTFIQELHPKNQNGGVKITGTLTSSIQIRGEETSEPYYYSFVRLKGQTIDLPVIFRLTDKTELPIKSYLEKGMELELFGHYSISEKSIRKSFTATNYRLLKLDDYLAKKQTNKKEENVFVKNA